MLVDKPAGMTSHDVVQRVRRTLGVRRAGHTGTLDPFATGLLVVLLGRATRLARFVQARPKTYLATARLGIRTDTDDLTGRVLDTTDRVIMPTVGQVEELLAGFRGEQLQQPPQYSAKHVGGERSYRRARRGEAVSLPDHSVIIHDIQLVDLQAPEIRFRAVVSAGTYLRAIARDLGDQLRLGAHLTSLRREAIGSITVEEAIALNAVSASSVVPAHQILGDLPSLNLDEAARREIVHGRAVADHREAGKREGEAVLLLGDGKLVAVAHPEGDLLRPTIVLETP